MALLKKNPEDPFAAPDITNGIRPIGKTHVFHKVAFRPLAQLATSRHKESWLNVVSMERALVLALKPLPAGSSSYTNTTEACARGRRTA